MAFIAGNDELDFKLIRPISYFLAHIFILNFLWMEMLHGIWEGLQAEAREPSEGRVSGLD